MPPPSQKRSSSRSQSAMEERRKEPWRSNRARSHSSSPWWAVRLRRQPLLLPPSLLSRLSAASTRLRSLSLLLGRGGHRQDVSQFFWLLYMVNNYTHSPNPRSFFGFFMPPFRLFFSCARQPLLPGTTRKWFFPFHPRLE